MQDVTTDCFRYHFPGAGHKISFLNNASQALSNLTSNTQMDIKKYQVGKHFCMKLNANSPPILYVFTGTLLN